MALAVLCAVQFMLVLDISVVNVALASIQDDLGMAPADLQWIVSAYTLAFGGLLILGGRAGDLYGRRRFFLLGLALFTAASALCGLAPSPALLIGARALQGLGGALAAPAALSLLTTTYAEGAARNRALGMWGAVAAGGGAAGVLLGGVLTDLAGWRWVFLVNVPVGLLALVVARRVLPESRRGDAGRLDVAGAVTVTGGLVGLVYGLSQIEVLGPGSPRVLVALAAGVALLAAFVAIERRSPAPLVPFSIFRSRTLTGADLVAALTAAIVVGQSYFSALYLQQVLRFSAIATGLAFLPLTLLIIVVANVVPRILPRVGVRAVLVAGPLAFAAGMLLYAGVSVDGTYLADVLPGSMLVGLGLGLSFTGATIAATSGVPPERQGLASGLLTTAQQVGGALGLAVLVSVASVRTGGAADPSSASALTAGFSAAFFGAAVLAALAALVALVLLPRRSPAPAPAVAATS